MGLSCIEFKNKRRPSRERAPKDVCALAIGREKTIARVDYVERTCEGLSCLKSPPMQTQTHSALDAVCNASEFKWIFRGKEKIVRHNMWNNDVLGSNGIRAESVMREIVVCPVRWIQSGNLSKTKSDMATEKQRGAESRAADMRTRARRDFF